MQWLREQLGSIQRRVGSLDSTAKLLVGSLVVVLVLAIFLVAQYAGKSDVVALAVNAGAQEDAKRFLADRGYAFTIESGKIMVPADRHAAIISQMSEQGIGGGDAIDFNALIASDNPFETLRQSEQKKLVALQNVLGRTISGFKGVKSATVFIAPRPPQGLGTTSIAQSASVNVTMRGGDALSQSQVDAIAALVAGTQAGLKPESVKITDGQAERRPRAGRDRLAGENLEHQQKVADAVRERIQGLLANIPGVLVSVNPQVVTKTLQATETKFGDGVFAPTSESRTETATRGATPAETPGVRPNVGMALAESRSGSSSTSEKQDTRFATRIPETQRSEFDPTGYAVKIDVGVAVPWSYFRRVWELRNAPADPAAVKPVAPDEAAISKVRDEEIDRIKKLLETQIATDAIENSKKGTVEVTWFYDFDAGQNASIGGGSAAIIEAITPGSPGGSLIKTIALGALALLSLGMMLMMVRKASERPEMPSASELAGVPPTLEGDGVDILGEADESAPPLEGVELDDRSLQGQQMVAQLNEIVKSQPLETAALLKRWMRSA
ncbi:MAG: flagellar M-ring protein FliF C-terminal domain-containing protein [Phycisphaerales bacterium]